MSWYLKIGDAAPELFAYYGLNKLKRQIRSQRAGSFSFNADGANADSDPLGAEGTLCVVLWETTPFFQGRLHQIPRKGSGSGESVDYEILDAWQDFERNVYQQQWNVIVSVDEAGNPTTAAQYRSECILGMDLSGAALNSGQVIADIVGWAIGAGAWCQVGDIGVSAPVPFDEITDLPCSECIRKMLRWTPDAVAWLDYSTTPPTFNVTRRADCTATTIPFIGNVEEIDIKALPDLVPPSVVIRYLQENQTDGVASVNVIPDVYPGGATGTEYGALVQTTRLAGTNSAYQKQYVQTQPIPLDNSAGESGGPGDDPTIRWWVNKLPWLQKFSADRLSITNVYGVVDSEPPQYDPNGDGNTIDDDISLYPNELISGTVAEWMNCHIGQTTWSALVYYNYPDTPDDESYDAETYFGPADGSDNQSGQLLIYAKVKATSAVTQTYAQLSSYSQGEGVPSGLAQELYGALSTLQYEGQYTTEGSEVGAWRLGTVLNLEGGREEWAGMDALLQEIVDDLDNGRSTLKFGPPGHLTLQDLMEQLRANRTRTTSSHIKERQSGQPGDAPTVVGSAHAPASAGGAQPTNFRYPWEDYIDDQDGDDGSGATWDVLLGYGGSSFAGSSQIDHSGPIEDLEISVGNDNSGWTGPDHNASDLTNVFSVISGDGDYTHDRLWIGAMNDSGDGGSVLITPGDPSIKLSPNLDPNQDTDDDQYIHLDLSEYTIEMQDEHGNSASIVNSHDDTNTVLTLTGEDGGTVNLDTSDLDTQTASFQQIGNDSSSNKILILTTANFPAPPGGGDTYVLGLVAGVLTWIETTACPS
jgi:hypothetical protein